MTAPGRVNLPLGTLCGVRCASSHSTSPRVPRSEPEPLSQVPPGETEARGGVGWVAEAAGRAREGRGKLRSRAQPKVTQVVLGTAESGMLSGPGLTPAVTHPALLPSSSSYRHRCDDLNGAQQVAGPAWPGEEHPWAPAPTHPPLQPSLHSTVRIPHPSQQHCLYWAHTGARMGPPSLPAWGGGGGGQDLTAPIPGEQSF